MMCQEIFLFCASGMECGAVPHVSGRLECVPIGEGMMCQELFLCCSVQVGWNVVLCRMSAGGSAGRSSPEPKKYLEKRLPSADIEIADRRRSMGQKTKRAPRQG